VRLTQVHPHACSEARRLHVVPALVDLIVVEVTGPDPRLNLRNEALRIQTLKHTAVLCGVLAREVPDRLTTDLYGYSIPIMRVIRLGYEQSRVQVLGTVWVMRLSDNPLDLVKVVALSDHLLPRPTPLPPEIEDHLSGRNRSPSGVGPLTRGVCSASRVTT
jgi:hypothetical protein